MSHLRLTRSSVASKRPTASGLADGQVAINTASGTPGLFFKDTASGVVKIGPAHVGVGAPNSVPAGSAGNSVGEFWVDTSLTTNGLKYWDGSAFVNLTPSGTTDAIGLVELATAAETQAGSDGQRAVTPSGLQSKISNSTSTTSSTTIASSTAVKAAYDLASIALSGAGGTVTGELLIGTSGSLVFEGSVADTFETTLAVVNPTADRTITLPNITGTVITTGDTGTVTSTMIADGTIVNADINASAAIAYSKLSLSNGIINADINTSAAIADTKLATISTAGKVSNSATTATSNNVAGAICSRDGNGDVAARFFVGGLSGNASTVTNGVYTTGDQSIGGNKNFTGTTTLNAVASNFTVAAENPGAGEGGQFLLAKPSTGSLGGNVSIDINTNTLRIFENGGSFRGVTVDFTGCAAQSPLLHANNYNSYAPTLGGGGASGSWNIFAYPRRWDGANIQFVYSGIGGQPTWLWGTTDGINMFVYNPSNFSVNYASTSNVATFANTADNLFTSIQLGSVYSFSISEKAERMSGTKGALHVCNIAGDGSGNPITVQRANSNGLVIRFARDTSQVGSISITGSATAYNTTSDYRLKENVEPLTGAIDRLQLIPVHRFNFIAAPDETVDGFLAHEVQAIIPGAITGVKDAMEIIGTITDAEGEIIEEEAVEPSELKEGQQWEQTGERPVYQGIDHSKLVPLLTAALQEAIDKIQTLEIKVASLENAS